MTIMNYSSSFLAAHLFAVGGSKWRNLRNKLTPTFTSGKIKVMFQTLIDCSSLLEQSLKEHKSDEPVDIKNMLSKLRKNIILSYRKYCIEKNVESYD